jgi:hypothetical protein
MTAHTRDGGAWMSTLMLKVLMVPLSRDYTDGDGRRASSAARLIGLW